MSSSHQYQDLQNMWVSQQDQLRNSHQEIQELARLIQRLQAEIEMARKRVKLILSNRTKWLKPLFHGISVQYVAASCLEANLGMEFSLPIEADLDFWDLYWGLIVFIYPVQCIFAVLSEKPFDFQGMAGGCENYGIWGFSCAGIGAGLDDACGSLLTMDIP